MSAVAVRPLWMVGAMLVPASRKPNSAHTSAWETLSPPLRRKITARISSSTTREMEIAMDSLLRHAAGSDSRPSGASVA
jgi:hypothetical protein